MADRRLDDEPRRFLLGVGLDSDGHARVTKSEQYFLLGGSEETHSVMRDTVETFTDTLRKMGTTLDHASDDEMLEAAFEAGLIDEDDDDE
ncbi:MAG: hypothetical protein ACYTGN_08000 [Planctomycetota bacterium]|jgi:hypothetical protein